MSLPTYEDLNPSRRWQAQAKGCRTEASFAQPLSKRNGAAVDLPLRVQLVLNGHGHLGELRAVARLAGDVRGAVAQDAPAAVAAAEIPAPQLVGSGRVKGVLVSQAG